MWLLRRPYLSGNLVALVITWQRAGNRTSRIRIRLALSLGRNSALAAFLPGLDQDRDLAA